MTQAAATVFKIPTQSPQPARARPGRARKAPAAQSRAASRVARAEIRAATRGDGEVIELDPGITVYPPRQEGGRWRAVWHEDGARQQCELVSEEKLAAKLEKVRQRLAAGAANMTKPGADLIAWYLNPDRLPVADRWSRKHADTQRRLCQRYATPVIGTVTCQDITVGHAQKIVNAAPTAGEGDRVHRMLSAMVSAGLHGGYLVNPMLARVHWQAGDRPLPAQKVTADGDDPARTSSGCPLSARDSRRGGRGENHGTVRGRLEAGPARTAAPVTGPGRQGRGRGMRNGSGRARHGGPPGASRDTRNRSAWCWLLTRGWQRFAPGRRPAARC
jgi:hypothetical protein